MSPLAGRELAQRRAHGISGRCRRRHPGALAAAAAVAASPPLRVAAGVALPPQCVDSRPAPSQRTFVSSVVDAAVESMASNMSDETLACIFRNAMPNCLDTTVYLFSPAGQNSSCNSTEDDAFIVTGDISAMWLRDSTNQVLPYMRFARKDPKLQQLLRGLLRRQVRQIQVDAYANAHNVDGFTGNTPHSGDNTTKLSPEGVVVNAMIPLIFERKYELDTLCAFLKLGAEYFSATGDASPFGAAWARSVSVVLSTMRSQQRSSEDRDENYTFQRCAACNPTDTLQYDVGWPAQRTGMVRSAFRPSDDATTFQFLVPANAMAVVELRRTAWIARSVGGEAASLEQQLEDLAAEIDEGIRLEALVVHGKTKEVVFAYEVDGFGNAYHIDDANVPSLLSLPYLGYVSVNDTVYQSTRRVVLNSSTNPFYFHGTAGSGVGSPHTGPGKIWPIAVIMQALTSRDDDEIRACLSILSRTTASSWFMHESFDRDNAASFSRKWFSWANSLFGQLILHLADTRPYLISKSDADALLIV